MRQGFLRTGIMCAGLLVLSASAAESRQERPAAVAAARNEVVWETSFDAAKRRAARENKPILLLHLFGRLDQEFC